jgi:glycosyltransferase involved in cell wall biosynthesis
LYLPKCIDSVLTQGFRNFELILVNDGSTDNSLKIINEYKEKDDRVHVINKENEGVNIARKTGVEYAKGEWILFVDSDDEITENSIAVLSSYARDNVDIIIGSLMDFSFFRKIRYKLYPYKEKNCLQYTRDLIRNKIHKGPFARLIRKSLFDSFTFDMPKIITIAEDYVMNIRLGQKCRKILLVPDIVYHYIYRSESVIARRKYNKNYERILTQTLCRSILPENKKLVKTVIVWQKWWEIKLIIKSLIIRMKKIFV